MKLEKVPLSALNGVGIKMSERLERIGLFSVADLLFHLPLHYQDRASIYPIGELKDGTQVSVQGRIVSCNVQMGKRRILKCQIADETGRVTLNFFHFNASQKNSFREGQLLKCF
ncbi:MAG: ATP-dependent DNA helicase RecG, partial [Psychromonas sp.]|nr:ATP-dependent DNA helicase RecG [Psychromonas sp.]